MVFTYPDNGPIGSKLNSKCFSKKQWTLLEKIVKSGTWDKYHIKRPSPVSQKKDWDGTRISFSELDALYTRASGGKY